MCCLRLLAERLVAVLHMRLLQVQRGKLQQDRQILLACKGAPTTNAAGRIIPTPTDGPGTAFAVSGSLKIVRTIKNFSLLGEGGNPVLAIHLPRACLACLLFILYIVEGPCVPGMGLPFKGNTADGLQMVERQHCFSRLL